MALCVRMSTSVRNMAALVMCDYIHSWETAVVAGRMQSVNVKTVGL